MLERWKGGNLSNGIVLDYVIKFQPSGKLLRVGFHSKIDEYAIGFGENWIMKYNGF